MRSPYENIADCRVAHFLWVIWHVSAAETRPERAASANSAKMLLKGWSCHVNKRKMLTKGQGQSQVKCDHHMKTLHDYRVAHFLCVIWHVEFDGETYFHIGMT